MNDILVNQQKQDIRTVLTKAAKSKVDALKFLQRAGLIDNAKTADTKKVASKFKK